MVEGLNIDELPLLLCLQKDSTPACHGMARAGLLKKNPFAGNQF